MRRDGDGRAPGLLTTERLTLTPLTVSDADAMVDLYADPRMYEFTGGSPPTLDELRNRYVRLVEGWSSDGEEQWCNWIIRRPGGPEVLGVVQATISGGGTEAAVAWEIGTAHQHQGYATEAARAVVAWLRTGTVERITATIHPDHAASAAVASRAGFTPTSEWDDGEIVWEQRPPS